MLRLAQIGVLAVVVLLLLACSDPTPTPTATPEPTPTPVPTNTPVPAPTPTPEPTNTPVPAPTPTPEPTNTPVPAPTNTPVPAPASEPTEAPAPLAQDTGAIRPLHLDNPLNVAAELSDAELACASGVADLDRLLQIFAAPERAEPDEIFQLINCMEDETVLRLFMTQLVGLDEPLSVEASACVRAGIDGAAARDVMLAGMSGDAGSAMAGSMSAFFLVLTCFNEEEFAAAAPSLGVPVDDREGILCLAEELGGPEKVGAAVSWQDEEAMMALLEAAVTCGLDMEGGPMQGPPPTFEPEATPESMTGTQADAIARILAGLSTGELGCLAGAGISPEMLQDPSALDRATPEQQAQVMGCLEDETLLDIFLIGMVGDSGQLSEETNACIQAGMEGVDLRALMMAGPTGDEQAAMVGAMTAMFAVVSCMSDEELEAAGPALGMTPEDRDGLECLMSELGGPEGMAQVLSEEDGSGFMVLFGAAFTCGLDLEDLGPGG